MTPERIDLAYERVNRIQVALEEAENPPTDLDRFRALFDSVGVGYDISRTFTSIDGVSTGPPQVALTLIQYDFAFDGNGKIRKTP